MPFSHNMRDSARALSAQRQRQGVQDSSCLRLETKPWKRKRDKSGSAAFLEPAKTPLPSTRLFRSCQPWKNGRRLWKDFRLQAVEHAWHTKVKEGPAALLE